MPRVSSLAVLLPLAGVAQAAMQPSMNNLTVNFFTPVGSAESTQAARIGTEERLTGTYALLVFDEDRCADGALCTLTTNLTSAEATVQLGSNTVHELLPSNRNSGNGAVTLPEEIDSPDGTMRLLFNTTDNPAPSNAADLLNAPWSNDRIVAGSEDTKPRKCRARGRKGRRRCRAKSSGGAGNVVNSTLDFLDGEESGATGVFVAGSGVLGWAVAGLAMLIVA